MLGITCAVALAVARIFFEPLGRDFDWPAWVQAIGSVAAILAAILVSADQAEQQRLRDASSQREDVKGVIRSLRAEVETTLVYTQTQVGDALARTTPGKPIRSIFPLPEYPFPIFDGLIPKLGELHDIRLQGQIIHTFALAKSLAMTTSTHNSMVEDLIRAETRYVDTLQLDTELGRDRARESLVRYGESLRNSFHLAHGALVGLHIALIQACPDAE